MASAEASTNQASTLVRGARGDRGRRSPGPALSDRLPRPWLFPLLASGCTWVLIVASWKVADAIYGRSEPWTFYFLFKDAAHYLAIAQHGYPAKLALPTRPLPPRSPYPWLPAFFPLFPGLIWLLHWVAGGSFIIGGLLASILTGTAAAVSVWLLAARVCGRRVADRAVILFCLFPGAMTFGMLYTEPLAVALAAATLLAMLDRRWVLAGMIAALGTAERPTLIVLTGVLAIGSFVAIRQRREWRSIIAAPLSLAGIGAYFGYWGTQYHNYSFWFATEKNGWGARLDGGWHSLQLLTWQLHAVTSKQAFYNALLIIMFVAGVAGLVMMFRARIPWQVALFTVVTLLSCVVTTAQSPKPRFVWSAFGIFIGAGAKLPAWAFWVVVVASAGLLAFVTGWWPHHYVGAAP